MLVRTTRPPAAASAESLMRHDQGVVHQEPARQRVPGEQGQHLVTVEHRAGFITENTTIAVAIMRDADPGLLGADPGAEQLRVFATHLGIDISPVGSICDSDHLGAQPAQDGGRGRTGRSVRGIDDDSPTLQGARRQQSRHGGEVVLRDRLQIRFRQRGGVNRRRARREKLFDSHLLHFLQFVSAGTEELDAIVLHRIVRSGDDDPQRGPAHARRPRHGGSWQHAERDRIRSTGAKPPRDCGLEGGTGKTRVAPDDHIGLGGEPRGRRIAEPGGKILVHHRAAIEAAHSVRAKILSVHCHSRSAVL